MDKVRKQAWEEAKNGYLELLNTGGPEALQVEEKDLESEIREWEKPLASFRTELRQLIARHFSDEPRLDREALFQWMFAARSEPKEIYWAGKRPEGKLKGYLPPTNPLPPRLYLKADSYGIQDYDDLWYRIKYQRNGIADFRRRLSALRIARSQRLNDNGSIEKIGASERQAVEDKEGAALPTQVIKRSEEADPEEQKEATVFEGKSRAPSDRMPTRRTKKRVVIAHRISQDVNVSIGKKEDLDRLLSKFIRWDKGKTIKRPVDAVWGAIGYSPGLGRGDVEEALERLHECVGRFEKELGEQVVKNLEQIVKRWRDSVSASEKNG